MDIYLVRHGQTVMNARFSHQKPTEPLNQKGREQATAVAKRLNELNIDTICSSPFARAKETAEIIATELNLPLNYLPEMVEIKRPNFLYNRAYLSPATLYYLWLLLIKSKQTKTFGNNQAETLQNLNQRAHTAAATLTKTNGQKIVVVSHAVFMNIFVSVICYGNQLTFRRFIYHLYQTAKTKNTTIFHLRHDQTKTPPWQLIKKINHP